jgi:hypothetical protein
MKMCLISFSNEKFIPTDYKKKLHRYVKYWLKTKLMQQICKIVAN